MDFAPRHQLLLLLPLLLAAACCCCCCLLLLLLLGKSHPPFSTSSPSESRFFRIDAVSIDPVATCGSSDLFKA
jgi:hypothetical protein